MKKTLGPRTMLFPSPVLVVGTYDREGKANVMTVAWGGICCSQPPCVAISLRKATYTYGNILHRRAFTINIPSERYVKEADYFGIATGKKEDKLSRAGLTAERSEIVDAPYVKEFPFIMECGLLHTHELGLHTQFVGEILDVKADEEIMGAEGLPEVEKMRPMVYAPEIRRYYGFGAALGKAFSLGKDIPE